MSEIFSNSVRPSGSAAPGETVTVAVIAGDGVVQVEVTDRTGRGRRSFVLRAVMRKAAGDFSSLRASRRGGARGGVAGGTPGTDLTELIIDAPPELVWQTASNLQAEMPRLVRDFRSVTVSPGDEERLVMHARAACSALRIRAETWRFSWSARW